MLDTRRRARLAGLRGIRYAVVIEAAREPESGECGWRLTTRGGERMMLTNAMVRAAGAHDWWLQGSTSCRLDVWETDPDEALAGDLFVRLYHAPVVDAPLVPDALITESRIDLGSTDPIVLLARNRPPAWPR
jgi:hypothetical protein